MPWNKKTYPASMKNLERSVREKAIEIANAILNDNPSMDEGIIIATAISRARDWASNRGINASPKGERPSDNKVHGTDQYVIPTETGWGVKTEKSNRTRHFDTKGEAVKAAKRVAEKNNSAVTIQGRNGKVQKRKSYNPNNNSQNKTR